MLTAKDAGGFLRPFQGLPEFAATVAIPGHAAFDPKTLSGIAYREGIPAAAAGTLEAAFARSRTIASGGTGARSP
jgi:dihydrofolate synthase/folylpolyglutamate synthase